MGMEASLKKLLEFYMNDVKGVNGVAICDREGLIITSESRDESDSEIIISGLTAAVDSYIDRFKTDFGTSNFFNITTVGDKKYAFCSMGQNSILTTIADTYTSEVELKVYSEHIAGKIEHIIDGEEVSLDIPDIVKATAKTRGGQLPKGEYMVKLIITGDHQVGKTSLIRRFVENRFQEDYISTLGVEVSKKVLTFSEETTVNFVIWDIGGQKHEIMGMRANFYDGASAAFIVCDRTRVETLANVRTWFEDIRKAVQHRIPVIIIGNKSDLLDLKITEDDIKRVADELRFHYITTSAKNGDNVDAAFSYIGLRYLEDVF